MWGLFGFWEGGEEAEGKFRWQKKSGREKMLSSGAEKMRKAGLAQG